MNKPTRFKMIGGHRRFTRAQQMHGGFALVVTLSLMILLTIIAIGLLGLASIEIRKSSQVESRAIAMANARMGLALAMGQLQSELGDDRRISADASIFNGTKNPAAVGVWNSWTPDLVTKSNSASTLRIDYRTPKGQSGFRSWLVSSTDWTKIRQLSWHTSDPIVASSRLFTLDSSGFDLSGEKISITQNQKSGAVAWAITQENTKARINIGTDEQKRAALDERLQTPSRPNLALSSLLKQPDGDWNKRAAVVMDLSQAALDTGYGISAKNVSLVAKDFTAESASLLTNAAKGGLKVDLSTGFELDDAEFAKSAWSDASGEVKNPFRSTTLAAYKGQKALYTPMLNSTQAQVLMDFHPASVNHKFQVNGVPTFDTLREHYRAYRYLYNSSSGGGGITAFERPYSHIAMPDLIAGRPFATKSQPSIAPVLDRVNFVFSIYAKADGTLCILISPVITIWNPYNIDIETEGLVVYPWIDFAVFWNWNVTPISGGGTKTWNSSLSRFVGEGYPDNTGQAHGRSSRPFFYLHLTQSGQAVASGSKVINPPIHLSPGEVKVFCLADTNRTDLIPSSSPARRVWRMKPVGSATDLTRSLKGGIVLDMTKSIGGTSNFGYKMTTGDVLNSSRVEFDRDSYNYIVNMADGWHIKNSGVELMVEARPALSGFPALPAEKNLYFYDQIHSGRAYGKGRDGFTYRPFSFDEIKETPVIVGSLLTYHRTAQSGTLPLADLMFTTNPRQPFVNAYISGTQFQSGPHYESILQGGSSLAGLAMETTLDGRNAYYGASHSANSGLTNLPFFEIPQSPILSLAGFQHCDTTATAFGCPNQIGNSWASPYVSASAVSKRVTSGPAPDNAAITPMLCVYDSTYLANEALFDSCYLSGAVPEVSSRRLNTGSADIWKQEQVSVSRSVDDVLTDFFSAPTAHPLRNPRLAPWPGGYGPDKLKERFASSARCVRLASHLMVEGGFNINSTSEEAWAAVLASLRGVNTSSSTNSAQSRYRHILTTAPYAMNENNPWSGFRSLSDNEVKTLASKLVAEIKARGPFLSLAEFVNRRVSSDRNINITGAIQSAIDQSSLNTKASYATYDASKYPEPSNLPNPNTGTNTPGWLSQADVLQGLAPFITPRSDTFTIRSMGEAKSSDGVVISTVRLEAVVQRVPDWIDPVDDPVTSVADLKSSTNKTFGRRFQIVSVHEIAVDSSGNPL